MKTKQATATTARQPQSPASQPFFRQEGPDSFFAKDDQVSAPFFQAKLSIGQPNDRYEQEADAIADRVVKEGSLSNQPEQQKEGGQSGQFSPQLKATKHQQVISSVQAKAIFESNEDGAGEQVQTKLQPVSSPLTTPPSRHDPDEEVLQQEENSEADDEWINQFSVSSNIEPPPDNNIQRKEMSPVPETSTKLESKLSSSKGGGQSLTPEIQASMGTAIGADFSNVRVHTGNEARSMSQDIGAQAFTHGSDIYFNEGKYNPQSGDGKRLLAHELAHTVQQGAAIKRKPQISSTSHTLQTFPGESSVREWIADKADRYIPAYPLLSVTIGYDLIRGHSVARTRDNILQGVFSIINPLGSILYQRLQERGLINDAFTFINEKLESLGLTLTQLRQTFASFWEATDLIRTDPFDYNYNLFKRYFGGYFNRIIAFGAAVKNKVFAMVKNAFLQMLVSLARQLGGYDLLADLLGFDPLTDEPRNATTAQILRGILRLPVIQALGGDKLLAKLEELNLIEKAATFIDMQWALLKGAFANIKNIATSFLDLFSFETLMAPLVFVNQMKEQVIGFVTRILSFFSNIATEVLKIIKEALIWVLKQFVDENTYGYDLVRVMLGVDPLTGEKVPRTAKNIIKGFVGLLPGGKAIYSQFEESGAIDRMTQWIEGAIAQFVQMLLAIKDAFVNLWRIATITDLFAPIQFFSRIVQLFTEPMNKVVAFVKNVITKIFEVLLQIMQFPLDMARKIIDSVSRAFTSIRRDPIGFLKNLLNAVKTGFMNFFSNIGKHLLGGITGWLFGQLAKTGIKVPTEFSISSMIGVVLEILDVTVERLWAKLAEKIGQDKVDKIRGGIDKLVGIWAMFRDVVKNGISSLWNYLKEKVSNLWDIVLEEVKSWVITKIIQQVTAKLLSMLDPTGIMAVVNGFLAFFRAIQSFIEKLKEILGVVATFIQGVGEIARGSIASAAGFLENALARALPIVLSFLANQVGLGSIGDRIRSIIEKIREKVNQGIDWLIGKAMGAIQSVMGLFGGGKKDKEKDKAKEKELPYDDPEKKAKVAAGLADIAKYETPFLTQNKISKEEADQVAKQIKQAHPVFKVFKVVDGKDSWDYYYEASEGQTVDNDNEKEESGVQELLKHVVPETLVDYKNGHTSSAIPRRVNQVQVFSSYDGKEVEAWLSRREGNSAKVERPHHSEMKLELAARPGVYKAGHLLNHNVWGDGSRADNVAPITTQANADMRDGVEALVKNLVYSDKDVIVYFKVVASYPSSPVPAPHIPAEGFICKHLKFYVKELSFDFSKVANADGTFKPGMDEHKAKALKEDRNNWTQEKTHSIPLVKNTNKQWINSDIGSAQANLNKPTDAVLRDAGISDAGLRRKIIRIIKGYPDYESMTQEEIFQALTAAHIEWTDEEISILATASPQLGSGLDTHDEE